MYNVNDPNIIDTLTVLTGNKDIAVNLYNDAVHIYKIVKIPNFIIQQDMNTKVWSINACNVSNVITKSLTT